ncbi:kinase-like domain-containing protein [Chytriomyces sp. MP71]|nr:kinase-like domain-containing protein [Chytriomyces sp. MP71]
MINNQYLLGKVLGRGSYGTVHEATDTLSGRRVAIKEMDAKKLRRSKAMAQGLRGGMPMRGGGVFRGVGGRRPPPGSAPATPTQPPAEAPKQDPIDLVRGEIAIMKKLQHPNIVRLYEVLHNPDQEVIYMVYELLEKGVIMEVGLDTTSEPFTEEKARFYFRQLILGIEYLHEHDIAHRDIKPDNLLISKDDVLKIVDFGVSEIFGSQGNDKSKKSEGSPAFFAPELCIPNHGEISSRAVDVWAMGVTLYCLVRGQLPFSGNSIINLYEDVKNSKFVCPLKFHIVRFCRLDKNPATRITVDQIREHAWVTQSGNDPLLPTKAQNCQKLVTEITKEEMASAVSTLNPVWTVMRAIQKFKTRLTPTGSRSTSNNDLAASNRNLSGEIMATSVTGSFASLVMNNLGQKSSDVVEAAVPVTQSSLGGLNTVPGASVGDLKDLAKVTPAWLDSKLKD